MNIAELEKIASQVTPEEARQELARIREEEAQQAAHTNAVLLAEKAKETFSIEFSKLKADKLRIDSELLQLLPRVEQLATERSMLENKLTEVIRQAENLARYMGQAGIQPPQPGQFLTIQDVGRQLILAGNDGTVAKRPNGGLILAPFEVSPSDSLVFLNLAAVVSGELQNRHVSR